MFRLVTAFSNVYPETYQIGINCLFVDPTEPNVLQVDHEKMWDVLRWFLQTQCGLIPSVVETFQIQDMTNVHEDQVCDAYLISKGINPTAQVDPQLVHQQEIAFYQQMQEQQLAMYQHHEALVEKAIYDEEFPPLS